jgi:hypothetical protein
VRSASAHFQQISLAGMVLSLRSYAYVSTLVASTGRMDSGQATASFKRKRSGRPRRNDHDGPRREALPMKSAVNIHSRLHWTRLLCAHSCASVWSP